MQLIDVMYNDVPHLKISNNVTTSVFHKVRTLWRYALATHDIGIIDQTTPLNKNELVQLIPTLVHTSH